MSEEEDKLENELSVEHQLIVNVFYNIRDLQRDMVEMQNVYDDFESRIDTLENDMDTVLGRVTLAERAISSLATEFSKLMDIVVQMQDSAGKPEWLH